jgi:hypothetical protein
LTLAALTALAVMLTACGGETTTTEDPRKALEGEVVAAYEASWTDFIEAGDPPSPDAEFLEDHLAGDALDVTRDLLAKYQAEGVALRGTFEVDAAVRDVTDDRAVVADCGLDQLQLVEPRSGTVLEGHDEDRDGYVAELTLEGNAWKVTSLVDDAGACA